MQQIIEPEQMSKLLTSGRTDLLTNFKSARTGRLFKAYLVWDKKAGKTVFEFEAKTPKAESKKGSVAKTVAKDEATTESKPAKAVKNPAAKAKPKAKTTTAKAKETDGVPMDDTPPLSAYDDEPPF